MTYAEQKRRADEARQAAEAAERQTGRLTGRGA
jgi:hypothetical protein